MLIGAGIGIPFQQNVLARLLGSAEFFAPLTHSAIPTRAAFGTTATFTRATTSTWQNNDGYLVTGVAGEIGFPGARRVRNRFTKTEDLTAAAWTTLTTAVTAGQADPNGGTTAFRLLITAGGGIYQSFGVPGEVCTESWYVKSNTGSPQNIRFNVGGTVSGTFVATTSWQRLEDTATATGTIHAILDDGASGADILVWHPQSEDVTAQTTQTAGEYVSVGALDYRSELNRLYLSLTGAGSYGSTADSTANSVVGDLAIVVDFAPNIVSGGGEGEIVTKMVAGAGQRSYQLNYSGATGQLLYYWSADGTATTSKTSTSAAYTFATQRKYIAVTHDVDNGAAGNDVKFWTSSDGTTWTQLGATATTAGTTSIFNGTSSLNFGGTGDADTAGKYYGGQIYNGIPPMLGGSGSATPVVDFNPHRDAATPTGTITSSTTGEVWTINGASSVVRSDYYHGSFVDGVKCFPTDLAGNPLTTMLGYLAEGARTNLCLQSNAFTTTWANSGTPAATQNVVGPDGATSAWTLTDNNAASTEGVNQTIALTAATYTYSVFVKKTTGAQSSYPVVTADNGVSRIAACTIDTTNGVATAWTAYTGLTVQTSSASCISHNANYWRVSLTFLATAENWVHYILAAATTNATQSTGTFDATAQGSAVFYGAQVELGSFASSYIPTTTIAVARNADVLTYSSAGNILDAAGWCYAEYSSPAMTLLNAMAVVGDGGGTNRGPLLTRTITSGAHMFDGTNLNAGAAGTPANNTTITAVSTWGGSTATVCVDGVLGAQGAYDGSYGLTSLGIGYGAVGLFGTIRSVRIGQRQLSASELGAITS